MPLVTSSDFMDLALEPEARWLQLRDLVEKRLDERCYFNGGGNETSELLEYVHVLTTAAEELEIGALKEVLPSNVHEDFDPFRASVAALATRLSLRVDNQNSSNYVSLQRPTRKRVLSEIEGLRTIISASELSDSQKEKAARRIDQLQILVISEQTDIARVGWLLIGIGAFAVGTTSVLADLPPAIGTISALIGAEKLEDEREQALIEDAREQLQIQDLRQKKIDETSEDVGNKSFDEIPF